MQQDVRILEENMDPNNIDPARIADIRREISEIHQSMTDLHERKVALMDEEQELRARLGPLNAELIGFPINLNGDTNESDPSDN